jgi:Xaa-Pro aminopeptidase
MDLEAIQKALRDAGVDGWLFCDFHRRDPIAYSVLGLPRDGLASRRWFYYVPTEGEPVGLAHKVEPTMLDSLPGRVEHYLPWTELHDKLRRIVDGASKIAMQYSPNNEIPYISLADAGTVELVRSFGPQVVSSADLVQQFEAVHDEAGLQSHRDAGSIVQAVKDEAYAEMDRALTDSRPITEFEVMRFIMNRFEEQGLTSDGATPIVGFNEHPADCHYEPNERNNQALKRGDTILVDLWARRANPPGVYYDITWCGFAGEKPPAKYVEIWSTVCRARDAALRFVTEKFESGDPCHGYEVDEVARTVVTDAGWGDAFLHRTGHSIGMEVHGNGVNIDNLETKDTRPLVPGVCFSIEPGIYLKGEMGVRTEIDVYITPAGKVEVFGPIQKELLRVG